MKGKERAQPYSHTTEAHLEDLTPSSTRRVTRQTKSLFTEPSSIPSRKGRKGNGRSKPEGRGDDDGGSDDDEEELPVLKLELMKIIIGKYKNKMH